MENQSCILLDCLSVRRSVWTVVMFTANAAQTSGLMFLLNDTMTFDHPSNCQIFQKQLYLVYIICYR
jgi:hypothetical protein